MLLQQYKALKFIPITVFAFRVLNIQIDGKPFDSIILKAIIEQPHLDLNPKRIFLKLNKEAACFLSTEGLRDFVRLRNHLNVPIAFKWDAENSNNGFQIYPESGLFQA